jgi:hypothetical protein
MAQIFHRSTNTLARLSIVGGALAVGLLGGVIYLVSQTTYVTKAGIAWEQPVQFSHKHHAAELGIDCRYCHTSVEKAASAGIPATQVCMNCHKQIWLEAPYLEPVRASYASGDPIEWIRVHDLPDFVYFNHSIHVAKGIGCASCHGRVDKMNLTLQESPLTMGWCLTCHRAPEEQIRPRAEVFNMAWQPPANQAEVGPELVKAYGINVDQLANCSVCHR